MLKITLALCVAFLSSCTGIKYLTTDLKGKSVVIVKSGWGIDLSVGAIADTGSPMSIEAGKIATVYISSKDGNQLPTGLADIIRAARGDLVIKPTGIEDK